MNSPVLLRLLHCSILLLFSSSFTSATALHGNETDKLALLAIKSAIKDDPLGLTRSWNDSSHFCNWSGVTCNAFNRRVTTLNLSFHELVGSLSPYIGNLTFLEGINLEDNHFSGDIPSEITRLTNLKYLNFSNNSFTGEMPGNISGCSSLVWLRLGFNQLTGNIPYQLGLIQKLERVQLHYNNFTGRIPDSLGNVSSIRQLSMSVNSLEGRIPESIGRLKTLNRFGLGLNRISGMIPPSIFNISSLIVLTLPFNRVHGTLPENLGLTLPNLQVLNIGHNQFTGSLPASLSNASNLLELDIDTSNFTGKINVDFSGMSNLWVVVLASNPLGRGEPDDMSFMSSLTKCRNLQILDLTNSRFGGQIPDFIGNLSTRFRVLRLGGNRFTGSIPPSIGNLVNLTELKMEQNNLSGSIPSVIGNLHMLGRLDISHNSLSGQVPSSISNITALFELHLQNNRLSGQIPSSFQKLQNLQDLDLSQNQLNGTLPEELMSLGSLTVSLNLSHNEFSGSLPDKVSSLKNLGSLDVSENKLSGEIPRGLGSCISLEYLHLEGNFFRGSIPSSLSSLRGLRVLDLSRNNLSGRIPDFFSQISLTSLNLSFNNFSGKVPTSGIFRNATMITVAGNNLLCGGVRELNLPPCAASSSPKKGRRKSHGLKLILPLLLGLLGLVLLLSLLIINRLRKVKPDEPSTLAASTQYKELLMKVSYDSLVRATDEFSSTNLLGSGSFGSVYKGILENQTVVAVKVLHLDQRGALKSFLAECQALKNIRHRNLVNILTICSTIDSSGNDFKALIYEFMPNGSLEQWIHPDLFDEDDPRILSLLQRLNILIDVASALEYLHCHCPKPVVHCDLKPSNILLDADMTAHVSDFGLSRFIPETAQQSSSSGLKGTVGYAAPEYGMGGKASTHGDIYSYGILLLEMFTGKRPTDEMFKDGLDLRIYVRTALPERVSEILDPLFVPGGKDNEEEEEEEEENITELQIKHDQIQQSLTEILSIGLNCSAKSPRNRARISEVVKELQCIRAALLALGVN